MTELRLVANRPGLAAIAYRIADHGTFKSALLARIAGQPALRGLTTRSDDDFAIAMLDAWSCAADVLTFYQQRLAHESYLRTAGERASLAELARLLGYELGPGLAAAAVLAFTLDPVATRGEPVTLPAGLKVQSLPGPGEPPQTFELGEAIDARVLYNELRPARVAAAPPGPVAEPDLLLANASNDRVVRLQPPPTDGEFITVEPRDPPSPLQRLRLRPADAAAVHITAADGRALTRREALVVPAPLVPADPAQLWTLEPEAGHFVVRHSSGVVLDRSSEGGTLRVETRVPGRREQLWRFTTQTPPPAPERLFVRGAARPGDLLLAVRAAAPPLHRLAVVDAVTPRPDLDASELLVTRWTGAPAPGEQLQIFRQRAAVFGHNAPDPQLLGPQLKTLFVRDDPASGLWKSFELTPGVLELDAVYPGLVAGDRVVLRDGDAIRVATISAVTTQAVARYALNARVSVLALRDELGAPLVALDRRRTEVFLAPAPLATIRDLRSDPVQDAVLELATAVPELPPGRLLLVTGTPVGADAQATEVATLASLADAGRTLRLAAPLQRAYRRDTVVIRANVARASHGETVTEVLGGGDPSRPFQRFTLKQGPLTFVSARNDRGRASTLQVTVDGEPWREVDSFESAGPADRVFTVELLADGAAAVQFGDGVRGARLSSGTANVRATYRRGLGLPGQLRDGRLILLTAPPRGVVAVTNPLPTAGAAAPEDLLAARRNAPLHVRTLGRVVSVRDYEDFARAFTGVAKALAVGFRDRDRPGVLVTIAGFNNSPLPPGSDAHDNLLAALRERGEPGVAVRLQSYAPAPFRVAGRVLAARDRGLDNLRAAVRDALLARFGFDAGEFARPVHPSELVAAIQSVPGVLAVHLTAPTDRLLAHSATEPVPKDTLTELLLIDPADPLALSDLEVTR